MLPRRAISFPPALALCLFLWLGPSALAAQVMGSDTAAPSGIADAPVRYDVDYPSAGFHRERRQAVLEVLPAEALAIVLSAPTRRRSGDVDYEYRQSSYLYYLTGTPEPGSVLVLAPGGIDVDGETVTELLFTPPRDPDHELWTGRLLGSERAQEQLGVRRAVSTRRFEEIVGPLLESRRLYHTPLPTGVDETSALAAQIALLREHADLLEARGLFQYLALGRMTAVDSPQGFASTRQRLSRFAASGRLDSTPVGPIVEAFLGSATFEEWQVWRAQHLDGRYADGWSLKARLDALRAVKTAEELALLRRAIDITGAGLRQAIRSIEPGMGEYEVEALIEYVFARSGAEQPGFPSIVGSGENSVVLHYQTNRRHMQDGDLVVMDVGAEYRGYSADITRTVPVNGSFSREQKAIYETVLRAQAAAIRAARPGATFLDLERASARVIAAGLRELGLLEGAADASRFSMHAVSHYLGLDVHDVGDYAVLRPGNVITVEPGIYIDAADDVPPEWWYIGVRIEDDILITDGDPIVLSDGAPKTVAEIEALMKETGIGSIPIG